MFSLSDLRGSGLIQRSPRPWGWSSPRPTPRWPRTSWLAPRTLLRPSKAPGHNSSAETPVSGHCLCARRRRARVFPLCHPDWPLPVGGPTDFVLFEVTGQLCCSVWVGEGRARVEIEGGVWASAVATRTLSPRLIFYLLIFWGRNRTEFTNVNSVLFLPRFVKYSQERNDSRWTSRHQLNIGQLCSCILPKWTLILSGSIPFL